MLHNLSQFEPFTRGDIDPVINTPRIASDALASLLDRLARPKPISFPHEGVILRFAACSESCGRLLVTPIGVRAGYTLSERIQMVLCTYEKYLIQFAVNDNLIFLMRLWALFYDIGKPVQYILANRVDTQAMRYSLEFLDRVLIPAIEQCPFSMPHDVRDALRVLCGHEIIAKLTLLFMYPGSQNNLSEAAAHMQLRELIASFPKSLRRWLPYLLGSAFTCDARSYTSYVSFVTTEGARISQAQPILDHLFTRNSTVLQDDNARKTIDSLLAFVGSISGDE